MLVSKYGERDTFLMKFNPDYQREICASQDECFYGDYPTLTDTRLAYGKNAPVAWTMAQLYNLSEYCGCRDKLQGRSLEELAFVISTEFSYLKISELMLFFYRFKTGRYGRFYGTVDPLIITVSLRKFVEERRFVYERHENEERQRREAEERKTAISYQQYLLNKQHQKTATT